MTREESILRPVELVVDENTSDGHHTFRELYRHRMLLTAVLLNDWDDMGRGARYRVHKSWFHHDGTRPFGGGWFIVMATLPTGQISYHYPDDDWDRFQIPEHERADVWDGHTSEQVADRLDAYLVLTATHEEQH